MNLEAIIQSEASQKEKNKYCIIKHMYGIWKDGIMNLFAGQERRHKHKEQTFGHSGGRRGWDDLRNMCITICNIDSQREFAV